MPAPAETSLLALDKNQPVLNALRAYCEFKYPQRYVLMVRGVWGSGKTHLIDKFIEQNYPIRTTLDERARPVRVSLYGVEGPSEISERLFQAIHPILSGKGMKLTGLVLKGLLKTTLKIDLNASKTEAANVALPDINIPDFLSKAAKRVIIFDDFERASLPPVDLLGYINPLVEQDDCKVIIVANEDRLHTRDDWAEYNSVREKTVGWTVEVSPDFGSAFEAFLAEIDTRDLAAFYRKERPLLEEMFLKSQHPNLRTLKQFLWEFERFFLVLDPLYRDPETSPVLRELMFVIYATTVQFKANRLQPDDILSFGGYRVRTTPETPEDSSEYRLGDLDSRYPDAGFSQQIITNVDLRDLVVSGTINQVSINRTLSQHHCFLAPDDIPSWMRLWHSKRIPEGKVEEAVGRFTSDFDNRVFSTYGEILHASAIALRLASLGYPGWDRSTIIERIQAYIQETFKRHSPDEQAFQNELEDFGSSTAWHGLGYWNHDTPEFKEVAAFMRSQWAAWRDSGLIDKASMLLSLLKADPETFLRLVCRTPEGPGTYADHPVLSQIDPSEFADSYVSLDYEGQRKVLQSLGIRYGNIGYPGNRLVSEKPWLGELHSELHSKLEHINPLLRDDRVAAIRMTFGRLLPHESAPDAA